MRVVGSIGHIYEPDPTITMQKKPQSKKNRRWKGLESRAVRNANSKENHMNIEFMSGDKSL